MSLCIIGILLFSLLPIVSSFSYYHKSSPFDYQRSSSSRVLKENKVVLFNSNSLHEQEDWRDFRAKLVLNHNDDDAGSGDNGEGKGGKNRKDWIYDSKECIEKGSIILSKVESKIGCHDLRQPYFHKCVALVIDHNDDMDKGYTKGIVLNRPSNILLADEDILGEDDDDTEINVNTTNKDNSWQMLFGGEISGLLDVTDQPSSILFLHDISTELSKNVSSMILSPNLLVTDYEGVKSLITAGEAKADSFYLFYGFCAWEAGQLRQELDRGSWRMVAAKTQTIWKELRHQQHNKSDTSILRGAGFEMWESLVQLLDDDDEKSSSGTHSFSDLMLKEWAAEMLFITKDDIDNYYSSQNNEDDDEIKVQIGSIIRAADLTLSSPPFLLSEQFLHKSIITIIQENDDFSIGLILNLPTTESYTLTTPNGKQIEFIIRYGGISGNYNDDFEEEEQDETLIWLSHTNNEALQQYLSGNPLNNDEDNDPLLYICTEEQVAEAMDTGIAKADDFMLIQGFCVWEKDNNNVGGITEQIQAGKFEIIKKPSFDDAWPCLQSQNKLSDDSLNKNVQLSIQAWNSFTSIYAATIERSVYGSNRMVSDLANDAFKNWLQLFLIGDIEYEPL